MTADQIRDLATRAGWTFAQTFLAVFVPVLVAAANSQTFDVPTLRAGVIAAGSAALAATLSAAKTWVAAKVADRA